ncbi:hypothetical protein KCV07_g298, partial [Aureobasidium melanogenum]
LTRSATTAVTLLPCLALTLLPDTTVVVRCKVSCLINGKQVFASKIYHRCTYGMESSDRLTLPSNKCCHCEGIKIVMMLSSDGHGELPYRRHIIHRLAYCRLLIRPAATGPLPTAR